MALLQAVKQSFSCVDLLVACRPTLFLHGLTGILRQQQPGWRITNADSLGFILDHLGREKPDLALLDVQLPSMTGVEGLQRLRSLIPQAKIVVLAPSADRASILAYLEDGAHGYLTTAAEPEQVLCALHTVLAGGIFAPASLTQESQQSALYNERLNPPAALAALTGRQREVFELMAQGYATKTIARRLGLAVGTVKVHLAAIYRILGVHSRTEAVAKVARLSARPAVAAGRAEPAAAARFWAENLSAV